MWGGFQVAQFLRVNPDTGLFYFDSSYRPVPLAQQYIGITEHNFAAKNALLNEICYKKVSILNKASSVSMLMWTVTYLHGNAFMSGC